MIKTSLAVAGITLLSMLLADGAFAKSTSATITGIDARNDQITLSSGMTIDLPENIEVQSFKVGERVSVVYSTQKSGRALASKVVQAK